MKPRPAGFSLIAVLFFLSAVPAVLAGAADTLIVRGDKDYPPFEYINADGEPEGFNIDIFRSVADVMGLEFEISLDVWQTVRTEIESGKADVLLGMYFSEERDLLSDFSIPHFISSYAVFVRRGSGIESLEDAVGMRIGVQQGDIGFDYINELGIEAELVPRPAIIDVLEDLEAGVVDCAFMSRLQGLMLIKEHNLRKIIPVGAPAIQRKYCFAVTEGRSSLLAVLNEGLSIIKTSGEYDRIYEDWFGIYAPLDYGRVFRVISIIVSPLLVIVCLIVIWNRALKKQVRLRTAELVESREYYRITLNSIGDAVISTDLGCRITEMNPVAEALTGWPADQAVGRLLEDVFRIVDADSRAPMRNPAPDVLRTGAPSALKKNALLLSRDRQEYPVADSAAPIIDEDGRISGVIFVFRDISEEHRIQQALEKRLLALTRPRTSIGRLEFEVIFNLEEIQRLQDDFSMAFGLSSVIIGPDRIPITRPSNSAVLCTEHFRRSPSGLAACMESDETVYNGCDRGKISSLCSAAGLWDGGVSLKFDGIHLATWILGQARSPEHTVEQIRSYARKIGCDEDAVEAEFLKLPVYTEEEFGRIINALETVSKQLTDKAYQNIQFAGLIREKSESEENFRNLQFYLSDVIDSMPSMLIGIDAGLLVTQWNQSAEELTGINARDCSGRLIFDVMPWLRNLEEDLKICMENSESRSIRRHMRMRDGDRVYENITIFPLRRSSGAGAVFIIEDITSGIRLEEMMIQSEKMVSVGGLAAGMAHEINNPLAGMIQTSEVLSQRLLSGDSIPANIRAAGSAGVNLADLRRYMELRDIPRMLESISDAGGRIAAIVSNMLSFTRKGEAGRSSHSIIEIVDMALELAGTDYDLKKNYDFKKIKIKRDYQSGIPDIYCESGPLQQVFLNIFRNGAQAMHASSTAEPVFRIEISRWDEKSGVCVRISDNGPGMEETTRKRVFEPFFTTKPVGTGTGLGMSVSYFIIADKHSGEMSVESEAGEGALFTIKLPGRGDED